MKYLGIPLNKVRFRNRDWRHVEDKIEKRCACWQGRMPSIAGTLCSNSIQSQQPSYFHDVLLSYTYRCEEKSEFL